ncbi:MAG TPA: ferritin-like domain-containing protein [Opitutaceae bacterium]
MSKTKTETHTFTELLVDELRDLYDAETQLTKALPKMAKAASDENLRAAFEEHLEQTQEHINRLERAFEVLEVPAKRKTCKAMAGLIAEGEERISDKAPPAIKDAGLIGAAQKVEHYEIAGYGTARTFARVLELDEVADILQETLAEEGKTDKRLTQLAESLNEEAVDESEDEDR